MTSHKEDNILTIALVNIHGQTGLSQPKQKQIETFLQKNDIDMLHLQEIDIVDDTFRNCIFAKLKSQLQLQLDLASLIISS